MALEELRGGRLGAGLDPAIEGRLPFVAGFMIFLFAIFGLRLFQLQLIEGEVLVELSAKNSVRSVEIEAPRGEIVDRNGRTLATTRPAFEVQVIPTDLRERERTISALGNLLGVDADALDEKIGTPSGRKRFQPIKLAGDIDYEQLARVESHRYALPGVVTDIKPHRQYVEGDFASHLIGYIGEIQPDQLLQGEFEDYRSGEVIGKTGVEKLLELDLRGRKGGRNLVVDVAGRIVDVLEEEHSVPGGKVTLTLDRKLQRAAEDAFLPDEEGGPAKLGAVVALDVRNGDVLAMVSKPSYDPNAFSGGIDAATWKELSENEWRPIQNRAISGQYPPGSIYKPFVAAAALEDHIIDPRQTIFCPGKYTLGRRSYGCWKKTGHGAMNLRDALKHSCDVYFYQVGLKLGVDRIAEFANAFFFGRTTGISLSQERSGLVPTKAWKKRRYGENWVQGDTVPVAIGQGYMLVTPLQAAVGFAALANGGKVFRPRIVREVVDRDGVVIPGPPVELLGTVPVSERSLALINDALEAVVEEDGGTARRARVPGVRIAGKTGTAQVVRLKQTEHLEEEDIPIRYRDHAWFAGFAPADAPEVAIVALVEHGGHGGAAAAPVFQRVAAAYFGEAEAEAVETLLVDTSVSEEGVTGTAAAGVADPVPQQPDAFAASGASASAAAVDDPPAAEPDRSAEAARAAGAAADAERGPGGEPAMESAPGPEAAPAPEDAPGPDDAPDPDRAPAAGGSVPAAAAKQHEAALVRD